MVSIRVDKRMRRTDDAIGELAESIQEHGLLQPIVVRELRNGRFALVAGGRRLAAARALGWSTIPGHVVGVTTATSRVLELVENLQRQDLTPQEEAEAFEALRRERGWTNVELAHAIKKSTAYISKRVRVFGDPLLRQAVVESGLAVTTAEEMLAASDELRTRLVQRATAEGWDATAARAAVRDAIAGRGSTRPPDLTQRIRGFRAEIRRVHTRDLNEADRRELRGLSAELSNLADGAPALHARRAR